MPIATDAQMQAFTDQRLRPRAEQARAFYLSLGDDKAAINDEYARATSNQAWVDARTDGPPNLGSVDWGALEREFDAGLDDYMAEWERSLRGANGATDHTEGAERYGDEVARAVLKG